MGEHSFSRSLLTFNESTRVVVGLEAVSQAKCGMIILVPNWHVENIYPIRGSGLVLLGLIRDLKACLQPYLVYLSRLLNNQYKL